MAKERASERAMRKSSPMYNLTVPEFIEIVKGFVKAGSFLIEDDYGLDKITGIEIGKNNAGKATAFIMKAKKRGD